MRESFDAIIVGGGPAGASCAVWLRRLGLAPLLVEAGPLLGGLANDNPFRDDWIAVLPGATGQQVAANIDRSVRSAGVELRLGTRAAQAIAVPEGFEVALATGETVRGRTLVIASGVRARRPDEDIRQAGTGGHGGQAVADLPPGVLVGPGVAVAGQDFSGRSVAILGGGDNAFENHGYVLERGARLAHIYARTVRAQRQWVERVPPADVRVGPYQADIRARTVNGQRYDLMLVFYGWVPQAAFADGLGLKRDARGHIWTDPATAETSMSGVYAAGEVAGRMHPCVVTSLADGVVAAKAIQARIESDRPARRG